VLGIVGESGSGKSVSVRAVMKLLPKNAIYGDTTKINYRKSVGSNVDIALLDADSQEMRDIRGGEISMIFQEPMTSFSPVYTVGNQIVEVVRLHSNLNKNEAREIAIDMLDSVGISNARLRIDQYPHEFSGGMRQRAMIAMALVTKPSLLIADEPTTALDMTIQAQILELIQNLQRNLQMAVIFITHNMGVIANIADEIAVMYLGSIVEGGPTKEVINDPKHPYTKGLLGALPNIDRPKERPIGISGDIPSPLERPTGCPFHTRCPEALLNICDHKVPHRIQIAEARFVECFLYS
jgi:peptide/nickel transport system ATP-binding protein